jgi:hypothetical protein
MTPRVDFEIRKQLIRYLSGQISLNTFQEIFIPIIWDIDKKENKAVKKLSNRIILRLAEYSNGDWSEQELKDFFRPMVGNFNIEIDMSSYPQNRLIFSGKTMRIVSKQKEISIENETLLNKSMTGNISRVIAFFGPPQLGFAEASS